MVQMVALLSLIYNVVVCEDKVVTPSRQSKQVTVMWKPPVIQPDVILLSTWLVHDALICLFLFIWGFTSLSTLYRSYHDG